MENSIKCPICGEFHGKLVHKFHGEIDAPVADILSEEAPNWQPHDGACSRCVDQAQLELQLKTLQSGDEPAEVNGYKILPTPARLMADEALTGKGVTICLIDSGFYLHPDLVFPKNRILKLLDVTDPTRGDEYFSKPQNSSWHGTMTSVVCAGNGHLSGGLYRGLASGANLVLLKVTAADGAIYDENIAKAIHWAIENRERFNIRIINLSVTGDQNVPHTQGIVGQAVEQAAGAGICVVAAVGNDPNAPILPPANSPNAISVGGLDDRNTLDPMLNALYHSTFGETIDQFQKPDLIAPAIWLAAPILPGTKEQREAEALFSLRRSEGKALYAKLANLLYRTRLDRGLLFKNEAEIKLAIEQRIGEAKYITPHYQHADGTSFAAPIVCSVIAQMLEANPALDPYTIREILFVTARELPGEPVERQGWGVVRAAHAVQMAAGKKLKHFPNVTPIVDFKKMAVSFFLHNETAREVAVVGDFNNWDKAELPMKKTANGEWKASFAFSRQGIFHYKFLVDSANWMTDPRNLYRENDGYNGFNSKLIIL